MRPRARKAGERQDIMKVMDITSRTFHPTSIRIMTRAKNKDTGTPFYPVIYDGDESEVPENLLDRDVYGIQTGAPFFFTIDLYV